MSFSPTVAIFCKVVDNFGDIGICWRIARQMAHEHRLHVSLWVDDLYSFQRLCPQVSTTDEVQHVSGIDIRHWRDQQGVFGSEDVADIVIEFFGCDIPPGYIDAMAQRRNKPVWLNLEGLSAEEWVEGCHTLPSMHPRLPLTKHFFFTGFTGKTGGLLHEAEVEAERRKFLSTPEQAAAFLATLGVTPQDQAGLKVSMFCYPHAPLTALFAAWQSGPVAVTCLLPQGVAVDAITAFLGTAPEPGQSRRIGALTVRVTPFVPQPDYDKLLWSCDLNFVRGEDSFVRAQWANKPFVWHIYPQDESLHHKKLQAFLKRYCPESDSLQAFMLAWNGVIADGDANWPVLWTRLLPDLPMLEEMTANWHQTMLSHGDLVANLLKFADRLRTESGQKHV